MSVLDSSDVSALRSINMRASGSAWNLAAGADIDYRILVFDRSNPGSPEGLVLGAVVEAGIPWL